MEGQAEVLLDMAAVVATDEAIYVVERDRMPHLLAALRGETIVPATAYAILVIDRAFGYTTKNRFGVATGGVQT